MAEDQAKCPDCGTPLWDVERRLEMSDRSHRHHAVDCVVVLKERVKTLEGDFFVPRDTAMSNIERAKAFLLTLDLEYMKHRSNSDLVNQLEEDAQRLAADFVPTSTLDGYVPIELVQLKRQLLSPRPTLHDVAAALRVTVGGEDGERQVGKMYGGWSEEAGSGVRRRGRSVDE